MKGRLGKGWTRRDFLRGNFLRRFFDEASRPTSRRAASSIPGAVAAPEADAVVMRYPKTSGDTRVGRRANARGAEHLPVMRPPGAVAARQFLELCTRCDDCADACPHNSIQKASPRLRGVAGTPVIDPIIQPCWLCEDMPCVTACKTGALDPSLEPQLGTASVQEQTCLAHQGGTCTTCAERCPVEGAITLSQGRPNINQEACTGCGICQYVCPAPQNAILLMPMFARPTARPSPPPSPFPSGGPDDG